MSEPEDTQDVLRRLESRLEQASGAAERLLAEAARASPFSSARTPGATEPPPSGWQEPRNEQVSDVELLAQVLRSLCDRVPAELQRRLADALRELLLAVRALIDWSLEHAEKRRRQSPEPEDIPIR